MLIFLIWIYSLKDSDDLELYNVKVDPHEKNNLAEANPEKVAEMTKVLDAWWKP